MSGDKRKISRDVIAETLTLLGITAETTIRQEVSAVMPMNREFGEG